MTDFPAPDKRTLRRRLRARRQALTPEQQQHAADAIGQRLRRLPTWVRSRHIALYWPNNGEVDPRLLAESVWRSGKHCYLPVLHPTQPRRLWFVEWLPGAALTPNRFGIPEPDPHVFRRMPARFLNVVLTPLVGFDRDGGRLGMGGGFYDCTFAFKNREALQGKGRRGPELIGLAHACQEVPALPCEPWDVPVGTVITDQELLVSCSTTAGRESS
ncbi:5-formyltetrahydrofolate cyclo-ligase [Marinimicrobium sp. ARAG 43.8]|uniref:5-formyltetrahydrofolate cyclo-ligase n=1 Tax=Marinimicrobium sp. ARAG 43.8 TaxID=3418719 RepID=UPI003CE873AD